MAKLKKDSTVGGKVIATIEDLDNKVKTIVPVGAKFTDTIYVHPDKHDASMITGLPTSLPAKGGNADTVGGKSAKDFLDVEGKQEGILQIGRTFYNVVDFECNNTPREIVIKTKIPYISSNHMPIIHLHGYAYGQSAPIELKLGYYIYNNKFYSPGVVTLGSWKPQIKMFSYIEDGVKYVAVALIGSIYYPRFSVNFFDKWNNTTRDYSKGWTVEYTTTETSVVGETDLTTVAYKQVYNATDIGLSNVDNTSDLAKPISTTTQTALNTKVDKSQVLTNVPANAKFTDTVYVHPPGTNPHGTTKTDVGLGSVDNIKQATKVEFDTHNTDSTKHITALERSDWNSKETPVGAQAKATNALNDAKAYTDTKVKTDVPLGAKFTDTVYTHPDNHPASMITESTTKRFVSDTEKASWSAKQNALGFTPENPINKGKSGGYAELDTNAKIPLSQLPDIAKQQTYVVANASERDLLKGLIMGEKCYLTSTGDSYIWNGISWLTLSKADWENVNLQWSNIVGKPTSTVANIDDSVNKRHEHSNKATINKITEANLNSWNGKAEVSQIPTKTSQLTNDSSYVTSSELSSAGYGDMTKGVYDKNNNGKVDVAELAESVVWENVTGKPSTFNPATHNHSIENISNLQAELNLKVDKSQVLTNVPANAKFTDTIYTHPSEHPSTMLREPSYVKGGVTPTSQTLFDVLRGDRTAFLPPDQIIIEHSTDAGLTWVDANVSDLDKAKLFTGQRPSIRLPLKNGVKDTDCMLRITISAMKYNVPLGTSETEKYNFWKSEYVNSTERYCNLDNMWIWVSTNSDNALVTIESATGSNHNKWHLAGSGQVSGWAGGNYVRLNGGTFGGGITQTGNTWNWRITFRTCANSGSINNSDLSTTYPSSIQTIHHIKTSGRSVWASSNQYMYHEHIYKWDENQNVDFPANVKANNFIGSASLVNGKTVESNVPANAKFTDTVTTVNGKTGIISKADIVALGIPAQDTIVDISGKADKSQVLTNVPANAKFTDTIYTHPDKHEISFISGLQEQLDLKETITSSNAKVQDAKTYANNLTGNRIIDNRSVNPTPKSYDANRTTQEFKRASSVSLAGKAGSYVHVFTERAWADNSGGYVRQLAYDDKTSRIWTRTGDQALNTWGDWVELETTIGSQEKVDLHSNDKVAHITSAERIKWDNASQGNHSHSNKAVLDKLTQGVIDTSHSHANKTVLDKIVQEHLDNITSAMTRIGNLEESSTQHHTHNNKVVLDKITQTMIDNIHTHANKLVLDKLTQSVIDNEHSHSNKAVLETITQLMLDKIHEHSNKSVLDKVRYSGTKATVDLNEIEEVKSGLNTHTHNYSDITGKPVIPTRTTQLTNDSNFITGNVGKITVSTTAPANPSENDIWIVI